MEDRNTETKDIEQGMVMAADVTDIRLAQTGYYWDAGYNEFDFSCKINGEKDIIHMVQQRHDDGYGRHDRRSPCPDKPDDPQKKVHARKFRRQQIEHVQKALLKFEGGWSFNGNFQHCLSKRK